MDKPSVYFDHAASTPLHPEVIEAMLPYYNVHFGNPSSIHNFGTAPKKGVREAQEHVAGMLGGAQDRIIFTASGTEANNIALKGVAEARKKKGKHIISSSIEHYSVLHPLKTLSRAGFEITSLPVDQYGAVSLKQLAEAIREDTILISIMHANNEVGTYRPKSRA